MTVFSAFDDFPVEAALVGRILAEYGELEFELCVLLTSVFNDLDTGVRTLYRAKGENIRIQVADAILRPALTGVGLKNEYEAALGALRWCKTIRNQYAHAHWHGVRPVGGDGLFFADLDSTAEKSEGESVMEMMHVDAPLLKLQEAYMHYASKWLWYLDYEYRLRVGRLASHTYVAPKIIEKPPLHNPPGEHPLPRPATTEPRP
jgi:hypothetical protein